jgi:hypothetical protein
MKRLNKYINDWYRNTEKDEVEMNIVKRDLSNLTKFILFVIMGNNFRGGEGKE